MSQRLKKWQRSQIRNNIEKYRQAQEEYFSKSKPFFLNEKGEKIFSLISPPFGTPVARRRVRQIMDDILCGKTTVEKDGTTLWGRRTPHVITLAVTYDCQCDCGHCSAYEYRRRAGQGHDPLSSAEIKSVIRQAVEMGTTCVVLTGGEPLLVADLEPIIASIDRRKAICTLFTNGAGLDAARVRRLKEAGIFGVYVSLDYSDPSRHDRQRQYPGLFSLAVKGIEELQRAGIPAGISTFISREKIASGEVDRTMDLARDLKVVEVFFFDQIPTRRLQDDPNCGLTPKDSQMVNSIRESYKEKPLYPRIIHQTMFASMAYPCQGEGCPAGLVTLHVRANGDVSPCDFTPLSFGNIRQMKLEAIWSTMTLDPIYKTPAKSCRFLDDDFRRHVFSSPAPR